MASRQVLLDVAFFDKEVALRERLLPLALQCLTQPRLADGRTILEFQAIWTKHFRLNRDGEIARCVGCVDHMKSINASTARNSEAGILNEQRRNPLEFRVLISVASMRPAPDFNVGGCGLCRPV